MAVRAKNKGNGGNKLEIALFLVIGLIRLIYYINSPIGIPYPDTGSYVNWDFKVGARTPGYPFIIDIFQFLFGERFALGLIPFQVIVSFLSVICFYHIMQMVFKIPNVFNDGDIRSIRCRRLAGLVTVLFGCNPGTFLWDMDILSESLAMSASIFFIYITVKWLRSKKVSDGIGMCIAAFGCTMVKASLLVYSIDVLILIILVFALCKEYRGQVLKVGCFFCIPLFFYVCYMAGIYHYTGVFQITEQKPRHDLAKVLESGLYKNYPDKQLVSEIEEIFEGNGWSIAYDTTTPVMELFGDSRKEHRQGVKAFNKYCIKSNPVGFAKYMFTVVVSSLWTPFDGYRQLEIRLPDVYYLEQILYAIFKIMTIGHVFLICGMLWIETIRTWVASRECPFILAGFAGGILSILALVYLGTYAEFARSLSYVLPFAHAGAAILLARYVVFPQTGGKESLTEGGAGNAGRKG